MDIMLNVLERFIKFRFLIHIKINVWIFSFFTLIHTIKYSSLTIVIYIRTVICVSQTTVGQV